MLSVRNKCRSDVSEEEWDKYAINQQIGRRSQTARFFFYRLEKNIKARFFASKNPVIQFGISSGEFYSNERKRLSEKEIVGYDISQKAVDIATGYGLKVNKLNLNDLSDESKRESVIKLLKKDLDVAVDVVLIRLIKYLKPETTNILMKFLIGNLKRGSNLYIETIVDQEDGATNVSRFFVQQDEFMIRQDESKRIRSKSNIEYETNIFVASKR